MYTRAHNSWRILYLWRNRSLEVSWYFPLIRTSMKPYQMAWLTITSLQVTTFLALLEKCSYSEFFCSVFSRIRTKYGEMLRTLCPRVSKSAFFCSYIQTLCSFIEFGSIIWNICFSSIEATNAFIWKYFFPVLRNQKQRIFFSFLTAPTLSKTGSS